MMRPLNRRERYSLDIARALRVHPVLFWLLVILIVAIAPKIPLLFGFMAAGTLELKSDGTSQLDPNGKVRLANGTSDSCCCPCAACFGCTNGPCAVTIIVSSVTMCTGCYGSGAPFDKVNGDANGTWDIPRSTIPGVTCGFITTSAGVVRDRYTDGACTTFQDTQTVNVTVTRTSTTNWRISIDIGAFYEDDITVPSGECTTSLSSTNNNTQCPEEGGGTTIRGKNGSASVTIHY